MGWFPKKLHFSSQQFYQMIQYFFRSERIGREIVYFPTQGASSSVSEHHERNRFASRQSS